MIVALIGYGLGMPEQHLKLATQLGSWVGNRNGTIICGGYQGTLEAGLLACYSARGKAEAVLEKERISKVIPEVFTITPVESTTEKHKLISSKANVAVAIGGGPGSQKLAERCLEEEKSLFVLDGTESACETLAGVKLVSDLTSLFQELERFIGE